MQLLFMDTETTGGIKQKSNRSKKSETNLEQETIEIAHGVLNQDSDELDIEVFYMKPTQPIHPSATETNGYVDDSVKDFEPINTVIDKYYNRIQDFTQDFCWVTYNGERFDFPILNYNFKKFLGKTYDFSNNIDLLKIARRIIRPSEIENHKLDTVFVRLVENGFNYIQMHRQTHSAEIDIVILQKAYYKIFQIINERYGIKTISEFIKWCRTPFFIDEWPMGKVKGTPLNRVDYGLLQWFFEMPWFEEWDDLCYSLQVMGKFPRSLEYRLANNFCDIPSKSNKPTNSKNTFTDTFTDTFIKSENSRMIEETLFPRKYIFPHELRYTKIKESKN